MRENSSNARSGGQQHITHPFFCFVSFPKSARWLCCCLGGGGLYVWFKKFIFWGGLRIRRSESCCCGFLSVSIFRRVFLLSPRLQSLCRPTFCDLSSIFYLSPVFLYSHRYSVRPNNPTNRAKKKMLDLMARRLKDWILSPVVTLCSSVPPNALTLLSLVFGLQCARAAADGSVSLSFVCWVINRILDGLDGAVARQFGKTSDFGAYLDILCDFSVYGLVPVGITVAHPTQERFLLLALLETS